MMQHQFAPGYRFYPTEQELITSFLDMKIKGQPIVYKNLVRDFDIYTKDPWVIWDRFGGDYLGDKIDQDLGLFFITELKKVSGKKQGSNYVRSVPSGRWHGDTAAEPVTDSTGSKIGFKKYFVYKNKNRDTEGHDGKWKMHEIRSLLDPSSNYVLCQLQKNDKGKRKLFELQRETRAEVSCDDGVHARKSQKSSSDTNQQGEAGKPRFYEPEATKSVCTTADTDFENPIGNSSVITDLTDVSISLDEIMSLLNEETDACASSETDVKHTIGDSKVIESWKTDIVETEVHTSHAALAVDMGSNHADTVENSSIITDFLSESVPLNETDTCALLETDLNMIRDSEVTESMKTDIVETEVHTSHAHLAVDMDYNHADAVGMGSGLAKACSTRRRPDCNGDFFTDLENLIAEDPQFASPFLLPGSDTMLAGFYNATWVDS